MRASSFITLQTILAGEEGVEPSHAGFRVQCLNLLATPLYFNCSFIQLAGVEGFEPSHGGIKIRCLTAWRHPYNFLLLYFSSLSIFQVLVGAVGFEPTAYGLKVRCSAAELHPRALGVWLRRLF